MDPLLSSTLVFRMGLKYFQRVKPIRIFYFLLYNSLQIKTPQYGTVKIQ